MDRLDRLDRPGKLDDYLRFNEAALSLRGQRQQVLASNIANADTPNYKARDIDFASALAGVLARSAPPAGLLSATAPAHIGGSAHNPDLLADGTQLQYRAVGQGAVDGNTVDMDVERNQFADNAVRYEAGITMINHQIRSLMAAIQGGQ
ncbi:MAG: flagellar basal body rod protein FlgB [Massilia sp.]|nr:flagellar basal body rod protein FlgB [Massilia sp.]